MKSDAWTWCGLDRKAIKTYSHCEFYRIRGKQLVYSSQDWEGESVTGSFQEEVLNPCNFQGIFYGPPPLNTILTDSQAGETE